MFVRLLKRSFIENAQHEAGAVVQLPDLDHEGKATVLSDHMVKVEGPANTSLADVQAKWDARAKPYRVLDSKGNPAYTEEEIVKDLGPRPALSPAALAAYDKSVAAADAAFAVGGAHAGDVAVRDSAHAAAVAARDGSVTGAPLATSAPTPPSPTPPKPRPSP